MQGRTNELNRLPWRHKLDSADLQVGMRMAVSGTGNRLAIRKPSLGLMHVQQRHLVTLFDRMLKLMRTTRLKAYSQDVWWLWL